MELQFCPPNVTGQVLWFRGMEISITFSFFFSKLTEPEILNHTVGCSQGTNYAQSKLSN